MGLRFSGSGVGLRVCISGDREKNGEETERKAEKNRQYGNMEERKGSRDKKATRRRKGMQGQG
jgi:hypothetical protein